METLSYCQLMQRCIELTEQRDALVVKLQKLEVENSALDKMCYEHRADGVDLLYAAKCDQWTPELLEEVECFTRQLRESKGAQS